MSYSYVENMYGPPPDAVCYGIQNDGGGKQWSVIVHTQYGPIGGKATPTICHYPFGGEEHVGQKFSWLVAPGDRVVPTRNKGHQPHNAVSVGRQYNDNTEYFAAIAISDYGLIPGKARGNDCWYPYGGKELTTSDFMWLVAI